MTHRRHMQTAASAPATRRHGLTLIELMLSLSITVMVAGAMSGMMSAVTVGVMDRQDSRSNMIRAHAAETKLSAYVSPSRAIWDASSASLTLWYDDHRQSDSIHESEVRWILYDASKKTVEVHLIKLPDNWPQIVKDLVDTEHAKTTPASAVYGKAKEAGYMASLRLLDGVEDFSIAIDAKAPLDAQRVTFTLTLSGGNDPFIVTVPTALVYHQPPSR